MARAAANQIPDKRKVAAYRKGLHAESVAAEMMSLKGYKIISRRYKSQAGEIDIVAAKAKRLAFIEVKARRSIEEAAWSITPRQQQRIAGAAGLWLQEYPEYINHDITFDAVLIAPDQRPQYIADAFRL